MINLSIFLVGCALGIFSVCSLAALYLLHRPRYTAPTFHHRRNRDAYVAPVTPPWEQKETGGYQPLPHTRMPPPPMPVCKPARESEVGGIEYRFMGATGFEE